MLEVVPEAGGIDRTGALASGESKAAGVEEKCVGEDLGLIELEAEHSAACHLTARQILGV